MEEKTFLTTGSTIVTDKRFVVGDKTFAMSSVSSVKVDKTDKTPIKSNTVRGLAVGVFALWLVVLLSGGDASVSSYIVPAIGLAASIYWFRAFEPPKKVIEYKLVLTTNAGEQSVLVSTNADDVLPVEEALVSAIVHRS